ncbi:MAG TPA: hypothetical protein VH307_05285 [Streptosporangiaceae bacterium]|nr:hypothetical protein [Streptosporangiaceae bacterium]
MIPPRSGVRELLTTICRGLDLPAPATASDEAPYLRLHRDRAQAIRHFCQAAADHSTSDRDLMAIAISLRNNLAGYPADSYQHHPLSS